ncbi:immunoglobulin-like domain-containing protein, partial [Bacillus cereus]|uniref:immunoglobulin-like domain-containing protein n=1 Tax=Bacillus cereus TaxID=1396 RepID=UPI003D16CDA9
MKKKGVAVALGVSATILLGGFGYTAYAKEPEIKTNELTISYGEELHPKLIKTSGDVAKTTFKTKLDKKKLGKQTITVEVENKRGINSQKNITVNVVDKEKPTIQSENKFEVEVGSEFDMKTSVKATDNYDGNVTDKIVVSQFDTKELGEKKVNVSVSDSSKNVTTKEIALHVVDKVKPELNAENKSVFVGDSVNLLNGVTAKDNVDGDITSEIKVEGNVDTNKAGTYDITYKVVDKSNNETTKSIQVDVKEKQVTKVEDKEIVNQVEEKKEV